MISLLIAIFGEKFKIPPSVRYTFLAFGLSMLAYRIHRFRKAQQELAEAGVIQQVIEKRLEQGEALPAAPAKPQPQLVQA